MYKFFFQLYLTKAKYRCQFSFTLQNSIQLQETEELCHYLPTRALPLNHTGGIALRPSLPPTTQTCAPMHKCQANPNYAATDLLSEHNHMLTEW